MKKILLLLSILFIAVGNCAENKPLKRNSNKDKVKEKDIRDAKQRWIQLHQPQVEEWGDDMSQHPIDEMPRRSNRELGDMCSFSRDCASNCCLLDRDTKIRSCQPKSIIGEKCSIGQVKGDLYVDNCPCLNGDEYCSYPNEVCVK